MKNTNIIKLTLITVLAGFMNIACSGSGAAEDIINDLIPNVDGQSVTAPDLSGEYTSSCLPDIFGINYRVIDIKIEGDDFTYIENRYGDFGCVIALDIEPSEVSEGTLEAKSELESGEGFHYQFLIPINANASAVRLVNLKKVNDDEILMSDFFFNDDEIESDFNRPEITLSK